MRRALLALTMLTPPLLAAAGPGGAADAPRLERITMASSGVAFLELAAPVDAEGAVTIPVPLDQVDDILKSLVVLGGASRVTGASLAGDTPLADLYRGLPFSAGEIGSIPALLEALRGSAITVEGARTLTGRIVAVEAEMVQDGESRRQRHRVTLATDDGLASFLLEDATALRWQDAQLNQRMQRLLGQLAARGAQAERIIVLQVESTGGAPVRFGWLAASPVWKVAWRLILDGERGRLQGWAVLENRTGVDWRDVTVSLVSGEARALRQELYRSYYAERPLVPVLNPPGEPGPFTEKRAGAERAAGALMMAPAPAPAMAAADSVAPEIAPVAEATGEEGAVATRFTLPAKVSIADGDTLTAPLGEVALDAERIAWVRADANGPHPDAAIRFVNPGATSLPPGILTVLDRGGDAVVFQGDAVLPATGAGETRLVAYAVDRKTTVEREVLNGRRVGTLKLVSGVLEVELVERETTRITVTAPAGETRLVLAEVPRRDGWRLVTPEGAATAPGVWRLELPLAAGATGTLEAAAEQPILRRIELASADPREVELLFEGVEVPESLRVRLAELRDLNAAVDRAEQRVDSLEDQRNRVVEEQSRTRDNLGVVPEDSDLARRLLARLEESEARITALDAEIGEARTAVEAASEAVQRFLRELSIE
jgi:hypothetical protein